MESRRAGRSLFIGSRLVAMALGVGLLASTFGTAVGAESRSEAGGFPNAGFEGDVVDGTPTDWTHRYTSDTGTFEVVDSPVRTGSQALRMVDPSDVDQIGLLSDPAPVIPGQSYEAGVWALVERGIPSWVMYYYDADGVQIEQIQHRIRVATGRSEERRVGKERRCRWWSYPSNIYCQIS